MLGGCSRARERGDELQLAVAAGIRCLRERPQPICDLVTRRVALVGGHVRVGRQLQLRESRSHRGRFGLGGDVAEDQVDVVGRRGFGIPRLIPRGTPHQ